MNDKEFLNIVNKNIEEKGFHITVVQQSKFPRYAYTIGNTESYGCEFIIAGNENFLYDELLYIFNQIVLKFNNVLNDVFYLKNIGNFRLRKVHNSWKKRMMMGYISYYSYLDKDVFQIIPDDSNFSLDIPNMTIEWNPNEQPIWKWLDENHKWDYNVPESSKVLIEKKSLFGETVMEVVRWEEDDWQALTQDPDLINENDLRIIPLATLLEIDKSLLPILELPIGKGLWRNSLLEKWNEWN